MSINGIEHYYNVLVPRYLLFSINRLSIFTLKLHVVINHICNRKANYNHGSGTHYGYNGETLPLTAFMTQTYFSLLLSHGYPNAKLSMSQEDMQLIRNNQKSFFSHFSKSREISGDSDNSNQVIVGIVKSLILYQNGTFLVSSKDHHYDTLEPYILKMHMK